jgi:prepilin-type N-terminal cleavage/methylation domain-containing protein
MNFALLFNKNRSFTLIELLIAMTVIGVVSVALLAYINPPKQLAKMRDNKRRADIAILTQALEQYYLKNDNYPDNLYNLLPNNDPDDHTEKAIKSLPKDPKEGYWYCYQWVDANNYIICAFMEVAVSNQLNGAQGTEICSDNMFAPNNSSALYCQTNLFR